MGRRGERVICISVLWVYTENEVGFHGPESNNGPLLRTFPSPSFERQVANMYRRLRIMCPTFSTFLSNRIFCPSRFACHVSFPVLLQSAAHNPHPHLHCRSYIRNQILKTVHSLFGGTSGITPPSNPTVCAFSYKLFKSFIAGKSYVSGGASTSGFGAGGPAACQMRSIVPSERW